VRPAPRRWARTLELVAIFGVAPAVLALGPRGLVPLGIVTSGALSLIVLLRDATFPRRLLWNTLGARRGLRELAMRTVVVWTGLLIVTAVRQPAHLFELPRTQPWSWLMVVILYPVLSAYSQELMFRTLFFHRFGTLFRRPASRVIASGVFFGWAHVVAHNVFALLLASAGGLLFASTYERRRSTLLVAAEHALYGDFIFTIGLGGLFHNARRLVSLLARP
jgi:membrane protease YdiL (CAAX protease family)